MSWILRPTLRTPAGMGSADHKRLGIEVLGALALCAALAMLLCKPIHQPEAYHHFHDDRILWGVPNLLNVLSNLPFVAIGAWGLWSLRDGACRLPDALRRAYRIVSVGVLLTGFGSAYYHWAPSHATLVWDRLPMAVAFMGLYAATLGERIAVPAARWLLGPLVVFGVASVFYWQAFDDLRPYILAQFFPLLTMPLLLWWFPATYSRGADIGVVLGLYVLAKVLESADGAVYALGHVVSGHTLKHLLAAGAAYWLIHMLRHRHELPDGRQAPAPNGGQRASYGSKTVSQ